MPGFNLEAIEEGGASDADTTGQLPRLAKQLVAVCEFSGKRLADDIDAV